MRCATRPTVLLVEDETDFREIVALQLQQNGFHVVEAPSAGTAWELAHAIPLQAVIMDCRLPGIDGHTLAYQLRHAFGRALRIVAFTAWPTSEIRKGEVFDSVHVKPDLAGVLRSLRGLRPPAPPAAPHERGAGRGAPKPLLH